jgi:hypothetical protein
MQASTVARRIVVVVGALCATPVLAQVTTPKIVSPGKTSAFANVREVPFSAFVPVASVEILRAKRHCVLLMQATVAGSRLTDNPPFIEALTYVEDEASGTVALASQTLGGQACSPAPGSDCTFSFTSFFDLDDPANAIFLNKPVTIELFAFTNTASTAAANATLAVQLVRK